MLRGSYAGGGDGGGGDRVPAISAESASPSATPATPTNARAGWRLAFVRARSGGAATAGFEEGSVSRSASSTVDGTGLAAISGSDSGASGGEGGGVRGGAARRRSTWATS